MVPRVDARLLCPLGHRARGRHHDRHGELLIATHGGGGGGGGVIQVTTNVESCAIIRCLFFFLSKSVYRKRRSRP